MTKTVTLRDDLLELASMIFNAEIGDFEQGGDRGSDVVMTLALDFTTKRLKELQDAFAAATEATPEVKHSVPAREREPLEVTWAEANKKPAPPSAAESKPKKTQSKAKPAEPDRGRKTPNWTPREDEILLCYKDIEPKHWSEIVVRLPGRNVAACKSRLKRLMAKKTGYVTGYVNLPEQVRRALEPVPVSVPKEELILGTDADGTVTSATVVETPVNEMSTQEIVAKVQENTSWAPFDATEIVRPLSHPAIKDDEPFIKPPTKQQLMGGR